MACLGYEHLPYNGQSAQDRLAYEHYLADARRGKTALQLKAVADQLTTDLRMKWAPQSFTGVSTPVGNFDATVCNVSYHFHRHGQKYGNIRSYTRRRSTIFRLSWAGCDAGCERVGEASERYVRS